MKRIHLLTTLVLSVGISLGGVAQHEHHEMGSAPLNLGTVRFENSCKPEVRETFTRAVALLYSFWYEEAEKQFRVVAAKDPACGMAWWGVGMSVWHPLWEPNGPNADALKRGQEALQQARTAGARTEREKGFIAALDKFYANADKTPHLERVVAYEQAMDDLRKRFPDDHEVTTFYALSLLGSATSAPPDKTHARQIKAGALLEPLVAKEPNHPGIAHYIIHAYDYPALATRGLEAARSYAKIAPDAPHALHMPSHIFTRLGLWRESIESNLASAAAAKKHGLAGDQLHALDYLEFAYLQTGDDKNAEAVVQEVATVKADDSVRFSGIFARAAIPARYLVERRQWMNAAGLQMDNLPGGRYAWADATVYYVRALGAARSGKLDQAKAELAKIAAAKQALVEHKEDYWTAQVEIQRVAAEAWLTFASGKREAGLAQMRAAVEMEDATDKHPVTPGAVVPMRALLGDMLLESKRPAEALKEFERLARAEPNRFAAVYGIARSAEMKGDDRLARQTYSKLAQLDANRSSDREELKHAHAYLAQTARK